MSWVLYKVLKEFIRSLAQIGTYFTGIPGAQEALLWGQNHHCLWLGVRAPADQYTWQHRWWLKAQSSSPRRMKMSYSAMGLWRLMRARELCVGAIQPTPRSRAHRHIATVVYLP